MFLPGIFASDDKASLLLLGIAGGLGAGIFEELGRTGFAIPELRRRYSVITTGLIVGFLWGAWHLLVYFWGSGDSSGALSLAILLPALISPMETVPAVYKPTRGEQPLWDFEENILALREVAAYVVSEQLGFHIVPFTILRDDGPYGAGSLQQFIEYDPEYHYFSFSSEDKELLRPVVLFDLLVNNADRKGSHVFFETDTHKLFAIDHGICFHAEEKLRTVLWNFGGQTIPDKLLSLLSKITDLTPLLVPYLAAYEIEALCARADHPPQKATLPPTAPRPTRPAVATSVSSQVIP